MVRRDLEIDSIQALLDRGSCLDGLVVQGLNLSEVQLDWAEVSVRDTVFLGCSFSSLEAEVTLRRRGAWMFPKFEGLPFNPYRARLYTWQELMEGWDSAEDRSLDRKIYDHAKAQGKNPPMLEGLAQRIHDHAVDDALAELLSLDGGRRVVGIMGGHGTRRDDPYFRLTAELAWRLTRNGYFVVTGGGPGTMEAGNLGAYFAKHSIEDLEAAIVSLSEAPHYTSPGYVERAFDLVDRFDEGADSLAVPTWFYGHEPSNLFATRVAKYFSNSLREDGLLAIALHGIVFAPGSAGTTQEIFQDATQNHYATFEYLSPMVFLGRHRYGEETGIYDLLTRLAKDRPYREYLHLTDSPREALAFIQSHPPTRPEK